jgi:hypothetical protein
LIPVRCLTAHKLYPNPFKALRNLINFCAFWLLERYVGMYLRNTEIGKGRNRMNDCIALHKSNPFLFGIMNLHLTPIFGSYRRDFVYWLYPSLTVKKLKIGFSLKALDRFFLKFWI